MSGNNQILPFALGGGANVLTPSQYAALAARPTGFAAGVAQSAHLNTVWRQSAFVASAIAQMIADVTGLDVNDDGVTLAFEKSLSLAMNLISYGVDVGTANAYAVTYTIPVTTKDDGRRLRFKAQYANTGASTFSPNGLAASPIWTAQYVPLTAGAIIAGGEVEVVWNSTVNSGNGAWILLGSTGGSSGSTGTTAAQFDNSTLLATTAFVQANGLVFSGKNSYSASQVLTAAADCGKIVEVTGAGGTMTLPLSSSAPVGATISFVVKGGTCSLTRQSTDVISTGSATGLTTVTMTGSDYCRIVKVAPGIWEIVDGTPLLARRDGVFAFGAPGSASWQKLPSGMIIQGGVTGTIAPGTTGSTSYPVAFPTAIISATANHFNFGAASAAGNPLAISSTSTTSIDIYNGSGISAVYVWTAIGA
jgi:hypothetical protein